MIVDPSQHTFSIINSAVKVARWIVEKIYRRKEAQDPLQPPFGILFRLFGVFRTVLHPR